MSEAKRRDAVCSLVDTWVQRFAIEGWMIQIVVCEPHDMGEDLEASCAVCDIRTLENRKAKIRMVTPARLATLGDHAFAPRDFEGSVVHELLHVMLADRGIPLEEHPEPLVHHLERLLLTLGRTWPGPGDEKAWDCAPFSRVRLPITGEWVDA